MILSASRRTDIPAFYTPWILQRLKEGNISVRNPRIPSRVTRLYFTPRTVDAVVFWTKNPAPLLPYLSEIYSLGYRCAYQFTLTPYDEILEPGLPDKEALIHTFRMLSDAVGPDKVVWRYDPVILSDKMDIAFHVDAFARLAQSLQGASSRCVISFVDNYACTVKRMRGFSRPITEVDMHAVAQAIVPAAKRYGFTLSACCEVADLSCDGVACTACIDPALAERTAGYPLRLRKAASQRPLCGCMDSFDVGFYDSCSHGCLYCYATKSPDAVRRNVEAHDPSSPFLIGHAREGDVVSEKTAVSLRVGCPGQQSFG